ncbi:hypothetical protein [Sphingobacterium sp. CZ-2]|uniref:hypothetical protein n=2 Tax=unclassified Sphingobacterium TaxID=2609468 RepID=UPI00106F7E04|nr:hypothetical protein [Sphingobacterium sp. CZ-2]QBR13555.1 hypothetical protein E3D81_15770 [Sphingobacterium sp. CZ-2]
MEITRLSYCDLLTSLVQDYSYISGMKNTITARMTIPNHIFLEQGGLSYLQSQINLISKDLQQEYGYNHIEYLDHKLEDSSVDTADSDHLVFVITFGVE